LPERWLLTHTPCQLAGARIPVPSALLNASLAANRFGETKGLTRVDWSIWQTVRSPRLNPQN